jgi:hypothetical protein
MFKPIPMLRWLPAFLAVPSFLFAQAPTVTAVVNSLSADPTLSPGLLARVYYTPLAQSDLHHEGNETVVIQLGGLKAWVKGVAAVSGTPGGVADVLLPAALTPGPMTLEITTSGGTSATYRTASQPMVTIAGIPAEVRGTWASPYGDYQVGFKVPPATPEGI